MTARILALSALALAAGWATLHIRRARSAVTTARPAIDPEPDWLAEFGRIPYRDTWAVPSNTVPTFSILAGRDTA